MARTRDLVAWMLAGTILCTLLVWGNLTWLGIGRYQLLYDDTALPRLAVAAIGGVTAWLVFWGGAARFARAAGPGASWPHLSVDFTWALLAGLAVWAVVSAILSEQGPGVWLGQSERLEGVASVALYAVLFGAGLQVGGSDRNLRRLAGAFVVGATLLSAYGVIQMLGLDPVDHTIAGYGFGLRSAFASLGNPNFLGGLLAMALPVSVAGALASRGSRWRWVAFGSCAVLIAMALVGSASQGAWLAVVVESLVAASLFGVAWRRSHGTNRGLGFAALVIGGVALLITLSVIIGGEGTDAVASSGMRRAALAKVAVVAALERPLTGWGPDTYLAAFRVHAPAVIRREGGQEDTAGNAHSWIPQYGATLGIPGALLLFAALASALWRGRPRRAGAAHESADLWRLGVWIGLIGLIVHLQGNVAVPAATTPFWILAGTLGASRARSVAVAPRSAFAAAAACLMILFAVTIGSARLLQADALYLRSRFIYNGLEQGDAAAYAERASGLNPLSVKYARGAAQAHAAAAARAAASGDELRVAEATKSARDGYLSVLARWPDDYAGRAWLAGMLAWEGGRTPNDRESLAEARRIAQEAERIDALNVDLSALANGDFSQEAIDSALAVPAIP